MCFGYHDRHVDRVWLPDWVRARCEPNGALNVIDVSITLTQNKFVLGLLFVGSVRHTNLGGFFDRPVQERRRIEVEVQRPYCIMHDSQVDTLPETLVCFPKQEHVGCANDLVGHGDRNVTLRQRSVFLVDRIP